MQFLYCKKILTFFGKNIFGPRICIPVCFFSAYWTTWAKLHFYRKRRIKYYQQYGFSVRHDVRWKMTFRDLLILGLQNVDYLFACQFVYWHLTVAVWCVISYIGTCVDECLSVHNCYIPAGTWRLCNVVSKLMLHHDFASTYRVASTLCVQSL